MFAANAATKVASQARSVLMQSTTRQMSVISGPPQVKISTPEQIIHGLAIAVGILAVPAWVLALNLERQNSHLYVKKGSAAEYLQRVDGADDILANCTT